MKTRISALFCFLQKFVSLNSGFTTEPTNQEKNAEKLMQNETKKTFDACFFFKKSAQILSQFSQKKTDYFLPLKQTHFEI